MLSTYQELKKANPKFPILVRESTQAEAKLWARYDFGTEEAVSVEGLDKAAITKKLEELVKKGESMPRCSNPPVISLPYVPRESGNAFYGISYCPVVGVLMFFSNGTLASAGRQKVRGLSDGLLAKSGASHDVHY